MNIYTKLLILALFVSVALTYAFAAFAEVKEHPPIYKITKSDCLVLFLPKSDEYKRCIAKTEPQKQKPEPTVRNVK